MLNETFDERGHGRNPGKFRPTRSARRSPVPQRMVTPSPTPNDSDDASSPSMPMPKVIRFEELARCGEEIWIELEGKIYRLRRTRQGKLILTK
jgi:hemin uptake protein HemP